jgi:hypothetical protein
MMPSCILVLLSLFIISTVLKFYVSCNLTWSLDIKGEHRLRVFVKRVFRTIFGPKGDEVIGGWRSFITYVLLLV